FTLAGLDILPLPPSRFVESLIALSIAVAALHNLHPIAANREWLIAFAFGLFHGMGFAGLVSGLDVSRSTQLVSLLGRNVGIEFGQAVIILLVFPGLFLLRRTSYYRPFFLAGSIVLATVSSIWTIERVFATDFGINDYVDAAIEWPRVLVLIAAFTAVAAILHQRERAAGRLLAVASQRPDEAELELATI
ncbi:MAG: HupE/UreJ family protein, partial [Acidimicrobiales bacterium]|nr:HupE/UreJ family protein [Acidimicrobiales bacterium]